tara:strand:- start:456 stop:1391 length:936 start_codon:yes stop_codon:yes gene_type:complete
MILLSGASGYIGRKILDSQCSNIDAVIGRDHLVGFNGQFLIHDFSQKSDPIFSLNNVKTIIHCAARNHILNDSSIDPLSEYRKTNTFGTLRFAQYAANAGVKRFIFISSIKVNGESTSIGSKFTSADEMSPEDPYGVSKAEAEEGLLEISKETGMEVVIIRPPLVYGPRVKGNFLNLLKLSKLPIPLPFALINNKRSMVYLDNLVDLIITCIDHPKAANRVFLASDCDDLSLARLLTLMRQTMNKSPLLLPIPSFLFNLLSKLSGKSELVNRLIGNLQVDSSDAKALLGWQPPYTVEQGVKATVDDFLKNN